MKTPRDKAIELVEKYDFVYIQNYTSMFEVKQCALIAVDEIISACEYNHVEVYNTEWWKQVKTEIEKL